MQTLRVCGRKKLPFAEYSVVKDQPGGLRPPDPRSLTRRGPKARLRSLAKAKGPFRSTEAANIDYVLAWSVRHNSGAQPAEASNNQAMDVGEGRPDGLTRSPRTFQRTPAILWPANPPSRFALRRDGGEYRSRTGDLLVANQALSQLS